MGEQGSDRQWQRGAIIGAAEDTVAGVIRTGYGFLGIPLGLLPEQSRSWVHSAIRNLTYGVTGLPRNLAKFADAEIDRWEEAEPNVTSALVVKATPAPVAKVEPAPVAKAKPAPVPVLVAKVEPVPVAKVEPAPVPVAKVEPAPVAKVVETTAPTPVVKAPAATTAAAIGVEIAHIEYDTPDREVDGEYVLIWNTNEFLMDLTGWTLSNSGSKNTFIFPVFTLAPGAEVTLWTKRGKNDEAFLYWNSRKAIWNNDGDTGTLKDASGAIVNVFSYTGKKS